jgi:hypothetical protein
MQLAIQKATKQVVKFTKIFDNKHQLLAWSQYATIEHAWYVIHQMDIDNCTLTVEKLDSDDARYNTNSKVYTTVRTSAYQEAKESEKRRKKVVVVEVVA